MHTGNTEKEKFIIYVQGNGPYGQGISQECVIAALIFFLNMLLTSENKII